MCVGSLQRLLRTWPSLSWLKMNRQRWSDRATGLWGKIAPGVLALPVRVSTTAFSGCGSLCSPGLGHSSLGAAPFAHQKASSIRDSDVFLGNFCLWSLFLDRTAPWCGLG